MTNYSDGENSAKQTVAGIVPKIEILDYGLPSENIYPKNIEENVASSSSSKLRSSFIGMGFSPSLVDKAIEENGEDNADLLLETLFAYTAEHDSKSSDSVDSMSSDVDESCSHPNRIKVPLKEELDGGVNDKKASLLRMSFSVNEVEFAVDKLGEDAPISELVDFIFAARMADNANDPVHGDAKGDQDSSTEALFGTMEKTLILLEMGFTEKEVSTAIEKCGSEVPLSELAAAIVAEQNGETYIGAAKYRSTSSFMNNSTLGGYHSIDPSIVKVEDCGFNEIDFLEKLKGKRPKEPCIYDHGLLKRPKQEYDTNSSLSQALLEQERLRNSISFPNPLKPPKRKVHRKPEQPDTSGTVKIPMPISCRAHDKMVATSPYFLYGNVTGLSGNSWNKISQYLYAIQPELVNTQSFCALSRQEGYIHNLPAKNRFPLLPKPPMTIEEAMNAKKWWPLWDSRKHLSFIDTETAGASEVCQRLGRMLPNLKGNLSVKEQEDILDQCRMFNLVWVSQYELAPIEPAHLERILGCPMNHTRAAGFSLTERLLSLKHCFQIDTLAYHLSGLKSLFPEGLTVLSIHSGIGGAEIALHRLGIQLKVVVSVEPSETLRRILKHWWETCRISGELVQLESIGTNKLEAMINKYGGFDFVICQDTFSGSSRSSSGLADFDFHTLCEFTRILARVRHMIKKKR